MATSARVRQTIRFGDFEADPSSGELRREGHRLKLPDQSFRILLLLLEHPGEVVTREELRQDLWHADTFVDFEAGLNSAIRRLRDALCESAEKPRYIETLPRRGYRFIGAVDATLVAPAATPAPVIPAPARFYPLLRWASLAMVLVVVASAIYVVKARAVRPLPQIRSVAVLPLANLSGDPSQDYFAQGITEGLTAELGRLTPLRVVSGGSSSGDPSAASAASRELDVDAVLHGSLRRDDRHVWVEAELLDLSGRKLWAQSYERTIQEVPSLQAQIARDVLSRLDRGLKPGEAQAATAPPPSAEAFDLYLRSRTHGAMENAQDNRAAISLLEKAVAIDPKFARGYALLSEVYRVRASVLSRDDPEGEEKAQAAAEAALNLDPELPEAYVARGALLWTLPNHYPHERAVADFHHALTLDPNLAEAHHQLANVYNHVGILDRGLEEAQTAVALDPTNTGARFRVGVNLLYQGKYEESILAIRDSQRFFPALWTFQTSFALFHLGRRDEAAQRVNDFLAQNPTDPGGILTSLQGLFAAAGGDQARAEDRIQKASKLGQGYQHFHHTAYVIGSTYALMNEPEKALKYLRLASDDGFPCYPLFASDHDLDNIRQDPHFQQFMADLRAQWEHYKTTM